LKNKPFIKGIFFTCLASTFWGIPQPLIFNEIKFVPTLEIVCHRAMWSFFFLLTVVIVFGKIKHFLRLFSSYENITILSITALLIAINWMGFIIAISLNRVQDASMGYFLTPMVSICLGYLVLKEKISYLKLSSIILMLISIIFLIVSSKTFPLLAIIIGTSWGIYGLLKKRLMISSEIGLLYESGFLSLLAIPYLIYLNSIGISFFYNHSNTTTTFLILTGAVTVFPLFFFNLGVKFIPLGFAGVLFYLAPSFHFITSVFILNENINLNKFISFIIIWIAVIIFIIDVLKEEKKINGNNTQLPN